MEEKEGQAGAKEPERYPAVEESPAEKLRGDRRPGSPVPGVQNPASEEIKLEKSPNTE